MENFWDQMIVEPVSSMLIRIADYLPTILGTLVLLIVGWLIAKMVRTIVVKALKIILFDKAAEKAGITEILAKGDIKQTPAELMGILCYWFLMLIVFVTAINALGLTVASELLNGILFYLPNIIGAIFILVLGMFLANFVAGIVVTTGNNASISQSKLIGNITKITIVLIAVIIALEQLSIATTLLINIFTLLIGAICLALGLAFGLGCKDIAREYMEKLIKKN